MKTNQEMVRYIDNFSVVQRTSDGYFDGGELLRQWNGVRGNEQRKMEEFLSAKQTSYFIEALIAEERENGLGENSPKIDNQVVKKLIVRKRGKPEDQENKFGCTLFFLQNLLCGLIHVLKSRLYDLSMMK